MIPPYWICEADICANRAQLISRQEPWVSSNVGNKQQLSTTLRGERHLQSLWQESKIITIEKAF